jgi:hypothetical protein
MIRVSVLWHPETLPVRLSLPMLPPVATHGVRVWTTTSVRAPNQTAACRQLRGATGPPQPTAAHEPRRRRLPRKMPSTSHLESSIIRIDPPAGTQLATKTDSNRLPWGLGTLRRLQKWAATYTRFPDLAVLRLQAFSTS